MSFSGGGDKPSCDKTTCPDGCCDSSGVCRPGFDDIECGSGGEACANCLDQEYYCESGRCEKMDPCEAGSTRDCVFCGTRECGADGLWGPCADMGECMAGDVQTGDASGNCSHLIRTCSESCVWEPWTPIPDFECLDNAKEQAGTCELCGVLERTCQSDCFWGGWECANQGVCVPETPQERLCPCSASQEMQTRSCTESCLWTDWSVCVDPPCNGHGSCRSDDTCDCDASHAGLSCERCNEPGRYFGYPSCGYDPPMGSCACQLESNPGYQYCEEHICRSTSNTCTGCGGASNRNPFCRSCVADMTCSVCNCECKCSNGDVMVRSCGSNLVQTSTCTSGRWLPWSQCQ